jgi:16S rRNA (guanine(1405)-N(7))-methyltransferase
MINEADIQKMIDDVQNSRKYRDLDLPDAFLRDLIESETRQTQNKAKVKENFRKKLHEVIAPYLEDIDYAQESRKLITLNQSKMSETELKTYAKDLMRKHASTRERLPHLEAFYAEIWAHIGHVESVLDLACALDPLALPWYNNPSLKTFCAIDIHQPPLTFLEIFFQSYFPFARTLQQDFIAQPLHLQADCAFLFKEVHRMEKRKPGCTRQLIKELKVSHFVISLPARDLRGHHSLADYHTKMVKNAIQGLDFGLQQTQVGSELLYFIKKP